MKAPLLLVIDDDEGVLQALEAELVPQFGRLCRIETFRDPQDVLDSLPRWQEEGRPVALAIVDQKMPGLTGIELLSRLREPIGGVVPGAEQTPQPRRGPAFQPVSGAQTVLLTGYGGPDIERLAKEVARVSRYRQKPWHGESLTSEIRGLLTDYLRNLASERPELHEALMQDESLADLWRQLQTQGGAEEGPGGTAGTPEDRLDAGLRRLLSLRGAEDQESQNAITSSSDAFVAVVLGVATPEQRAVVRDAVVRSPALRREFAQLLRDLSLLRQPEARRSFESVEVPGWVRSVTPGPPREGE